MNVDAISPVADLLDRKSLDELVRLSSRNSGFFARVVRLYSMHAPEVVEAIKRRAAAGDLDEAAQAAHSLKSMSLNMGAIAAANLAARLELNAKGGALPTVNNLVELEGAVSNTCSFLAGEAVNVKKALSSERSNGRNRSEPDIEQRGGFVGGRKVGQPNG